MPNVRLVKCDDSDLAVGLNKGDILDVLCLATGDGALYFIVDAPGQKGYHLLRDQLELLGDMGD